MTVTGLVEAERNDLADFLETLAPQQWAARSLCEGWTVRDVAAHVVSYEAVGAAELTRRFLQGRGVKVVATDLDWSGGTGPEARGGAEAVLMAMGGRRGVAGELTGPGAPRLVKRLG